MPRQNVPLAERLFNAVVIAMLLWYGSYAFLYFFQAGNGSGAKPLYSYLLTVFVAGAYMIYSLAFGTARYAWRAKGTRTFIAWLFGLLIYCCLAFVNSTQDEKAQQALIDLFETIILVSCFWYTMSHPARMPAIDKTLVVLALFACAINFYDFPTAAFTDFPGRAAGLYGNPNMSGAFIALSMVAGMSVVPRSLRIPFAGICAAGILLTFSRENMLIWMVGVVALSLAKFFPGTGIRYMRIVAAAVSGGLVLALLSGLLASFVESTDLSRYLTADTEARLGIGAAVGSDYAAGDRMFLVKVSWDEFLESPLLGHGLGYTNEWQLDRRPHNMFLLFLVEGGILGGLLYLAYLLMLWQNSTSVGRIIVVQIFVLSFFSHNLLDAPAITLFSAFIVAQGSLSQRGSRRPGASQPNNGRGLPLPSHRVSAGFGTSL